MPHLPRTCPKNSKLVASSSCIILLFFNCFFLKASLVEVVEREKREKERKKMNALGRQAQRSGASTMHQRQYSENFIDASSNGRWLQSAGLQHLQSSNASVPSLQVLIFLCFFPFTSCLVAKKEYRKEKEILFFFWLT